MRNPYCGVNVGLRNAEIALQSAPKEHRYPPQDTPNTHLQELSHRKRFVRVRLLHHPGEALRDRVVVHRA